VFVADFLGVSNLMDAESVAWGEGECSVRVGEATLRAGCGDVAARGPVKIVVRPERLRLLPHGTGQPNCLPGMVERTVYVGASMQVIVRLPTGATLQASLANIGARDSYDQGAPVAVHLPQEALRVLGPGSAPGPRSDDSPALAPVLATGAAP
jgi:ABC-type Fe3+/spermidine/putrescine transport system ATPase subunit